MTEASASPSTDIAIPWHTVSFEETTLAYRKSFLREAKERNFPTRNLRNPGEPFKVSIQCSEPELHALRELTDQAINSKRRGKEESDIEWNLYETNEEGRDYRDMLARCARSKRFQVKAGRGEAGGWYVRIYCTKPRYEELHVETVSKLQERTTSETIRKSIRPDPFEFKEVLAKDLNEKLENLHKARDLFAKDPDEHFCDVNSAGKILYQSLREQTLNGLRINFVLKEGTERYVRWIGERFKMFCFQASGERAPLAVSLTANQFIDLSLVDSLSVV